MTAHIRLIDLRRLLMRLPALGLRVGTQPQCDVLRLHRLLHHPYQAVAEGAQICLVTQPGVEGAEHLCRIILPAVETPVYNRLDTPSQRSEKSRDHQRRSDYGQLRQLLVAGETDENTLR